jgi:hypothetical protein
MTSILSEEAIERVGSIDEKTLLEYAQEAVKPFLRSGYRVLTSTELHRKKFRIFNSKFRSVVKSGLIKEHKLQGSGVSDYYVAYEITGKLAEALGISINELKERNEVLPKNLLEAVRKFAKERGEFRTRDIESKFNLPPPKARTFIRNIWPISETRRGKDIIYSFKPVKIPKEVERFYEDYPTSGVNKFKLGYLLEKERNRRRKLTPEDVSREIGIGVRSAIVYVGALSTLETKYAKRS